MGPKRRSREKIVDFDRRRALSILNRLQWLKYKKYKLSASTRKQMQLLRSVVPDWKEDDGKSAADSVEIRVRRITTNTNYEKLTETPISKILSEAKKGSGRLDDLPIKNDPFSGLATEKPVRAFTALTYAAKQKDFPDWAWQSFLASETRKNDKTRLTWLIAKRLARYPNARLTTILYPVSRWLKDASTKLSKDCLPVFDHILNKLTDVLRETPNEGGLSINRGYKRTKLGDRSD